MSQLALYQSVLQKLGQLSPNDLAELDAFLSRLVKQKKTAKPKNAISHLAGAWENWDDNAFEEYLKDTQQTRENLFIHQPFEP